MSQRFTRFRFRYLMLPIMLLTGVCTYVLSQNSESPFEQHFAQKHSKSNHVSLTISLDNENRRIRIAIRNETNRRITVSDGPGFLTAVVIRRSGKQIPILWDGYNADLGPLTWSQVMHLPPQATISFSKALDLKRSGPLQVGELVSAKLMPVAVNDFSENIRRFVENDKLQLLATVAQSKPIQIKPIGH